MNKETILFDDDKYVKLEILNKIAELAKLLGINGIDRAKCSGFFDLIICFTSEDNRNNKSYKTDIFTYGSSYNRESWGIYESDGTRMFNHDDKKHIVSGSIIYD